MDPGAGVPTVDDARLKDGVDVTFAGRLPLFCSRVHLRSLSFPTWRITILVGVSELSSRASRPTNLLADVLVSWW
jgi:hypothetical protein